MGCCGRARANLGVAPAASRPAAQPARAASREPLLRRPIAPGSTVTLRYVGAGAVTVRGPRTGQAYAFGAAGAMQAVDERDAVVLLQTAYFRPA
jgi:hypothetical protein